MAEWRPSRPALVQACALVRQHASAAVRRRLAILEALLKRPDTPLKEIARHAVTRTRVVRQLLRRWRLEGIDSLIQFGRPADLTTAQLRELKRVIASFPLRSLIEVDDWLTKKQGVKFSQPTLRHYCQQCGFDLPAKFKVSKAEKPIHRRQPWSANQIADLKQIEPKLKRRVTTVLRAGTEVELSLNCIARESGVPASSLRLDLKRFTRGGTKALLKHQRLENRLRRIGVWDAFKFWCSKYYHQHGLCPPAKLAAKYLRQTHRLRLPFRTVYTYLTLWRRDAGIPLRRWRSRDNFVPSEGLVVRAIRP